ncbi:Taurine catabolism dioxygenase TauD, TfdA family [Saccharomonospora marina XMU15]|uniref:Taurine catabolism dioxygenase TauD, TfdA family n=1 Tax=Saccharomonospora marina XMU15 TaxID=882083 RepID=H5X6Z5_9PSEU|nr:TauD/TfdA family dioxygenase [Saccharomonospora marina]EHR52425.1 Taurine catabolism dioxygenase TauD, TfdA family [Saccharomonospora marina XMU15]
MTVAVPQDVLRRAITARPTTFKGVPAEPVAWTGTEAVTETLRRYDRHGFAVVRVLAGPLNEDTVLRLAGELGLDKPFIPPLYTRGGRAAPPVSRIATPPVAPPSGAVHPGFETRNGQDLHCDGTLQDIGQVKAVILLCVAQGLSGGTTSLFNAHGAVAELLDHDPEAAKALTAPGLLQRQATINGSTEAVATPVCTVQDGQIVCRYCVSTTDRWVLPDGPELRTVQRGLEFLDLARRESSPHLLRFVLGAGHALILDNTRLSHGRDPYQDDDRHRRLLYRSLHLSHPAAPREPAAP